MFDPSIIQNPAAAKQREAVANAVRSEISSGTFTYTELLSAMEPMRTMALECLDGIVMNGTVPGAGGEVENWGGERIRLVHIDPGGTIKHPVMQDVRVPGTNQVKRQKVMKDFGNIVDMTDVGPTERLARNVLYQRGWPVKQNKSGGSREGDVIEWRWLEKEAALGDKAAPGVVDMYLALLPRVEAFDEALAKAAEAAAQAKADKKTKTTKNAGAPAPAGV
jgi:hypothetical protein